jgi:hypothetical protein
MSLRYLRRPPKPSSRNSAAPAVKCALRTKEASGPAKLPVGIDPDERAKLAQALAFFCAACGREHASGAVCCNDVICAEADIVAVIRRAQ